MEQRRKCSRQGYASVHYSFAESKENILVQKHERRKFWRALLHSPVCLTTSSGDADAQLIDISLKGVILETENAWKGKPGVECRVILELARGVTSSMRAIGMHVAGPHTSVHCASIKLGSIAHLRRLVKFNRSDPAMLDREFRSLIRQA
ncbi:MAG: PilZ domain-containing protein [Sideroxyarcus sp.]|nr:PilZ domain-containing protein [Sideroxyarcus sp.]